VYYLYIPENPIEEKRWVLFENCFPMGRFYFRITGESKKSPEIQQPADVPVVTENSEK